jgi:hypothetical protein
VGDYIHEATLAEVLWLMLTHRVDSDDDNDDDDDDDDLHHLMI